MAHATKEKRNDYNRRYHTHSPRHDYLYNLRLMGKPQVVPLSAGNGHVCEEIPLCRQPAAYALVFDGETVNLCTEGFERWKEVNK